jgi:hypothetical protein
MAKKATFELGNSVTWTSQSAGYTRTKTGVVEQVVAPNKLPDRAQFEALYRTSGVGLPRAEESYVVRVPGKTTRSAGKLYWPHAGKLTLASAEEPVA